MQLLASLWFVFAVGSLFTERDHDDHQLKRGQLSSTAEFQDQGQSPQSEQQASFWNSVDPFCANNSRLKDFARAVWHVHCFYRQPSQGSTRRTKPSYFQQWLSSPDQQCDAPFPHLTPVQPLHPTSGFPWVGPLELQWKTIRQELHEFLAAVERNATGTSGIIRKEAAVAAPAQQGKSSPTTTTAWKTSTTKLCDDTTGFAKVTIRDEVGRATALGHQYFSQTLSLLQQLESSSGLALAPRPINIHCQAPQSGLAPHSDNMNFLLTCHLGLDVPTDAKCWFHIGKDHHYSWEQGKVVIADTSFVHSTENPSPSQARYVLSFCIWHPDLTRQEMDGIQAIHRAISSLS